MKYCDCKSCNGVGLVGDDGECCGCVKMGCKDTHAHNPPAMNYLKESERRQVMHDTIAELRDALRLAVAENERWRCADSYGDMIGVLAGDYGDDDKGGHGMVHREQIRAARAATDANATIAGVRKEIAP